MTNKELQEKLQMFPDDMHVCYSHPMLNDPYYGVEIQTVDREKGLTDLHGVTEYVALS